MSCTANSCSPSWPTDLRPDGTHGDSWFGLTDERLIVIQPNGTEEPDTEIVPLRDIQRVQTRNYVGSGALVIDLADETVELLRFSQSAYYKFSAVPHIVEAASVGLVPKVEEEKEETVQTPSVKPVESCPSCGRALKPGTKVCAYCIRKTETFWRLFSYVRPYKRIALSGLLLTLGFTAINLLPPLLNKVLIDDVITPVIADYDETQKEGLEALTPPQDVVNLLFWVVLGLVGVYVGRALINGIRTYCLGWLGQHVVYDLQTEIFSHLQLLSLSFYNQYRAYHDQGDQ